MEWVKLFTSYFDDLAIATADDAAEVMFTRALAYVGRAETGGFIPNAQLHHLTRRPGQARRIADRLTRPDPAGQPGPFEKVDGGYRIRSWDRRQDQLEALTQRRKSDRDRQRRRRHRDREPGTASRDGHVTVTAMSRGESRGRVEEDTAAAAAVDPAAAAAAVDNPADLPTPIAILRDKLQAHTTLQALRFDGLTSDKIAQLQILIDRHGDTRLVNTAIHTLRTPPPVHVAAFLGTWEALPAPGQRLAAVPDDPCDEPGHSGTIRHCIQCASEAKAAR